MNRRSFLKLIGATAAVAAVSPGTVIAATDKHPELLVTHYPLGGIRPEKLLRWDLGEYLVGGYVLPAPVGHKCRAIIEMRTETPKDTWVQPAMVGVFNEPGQIVISHAGHSDGPSMLMSEIDAAIMMFEGGPVPVDWGIISHKRGLEIDYEAMTRLDSSLELIREDRELYLALYFTIHQGFGCPGFGPTP